MNHCCLDFFRGIVAQSTDDLVPHLFLRHILLYSHYHILSHFSPPHTSLTSTGSVFVVPPFMILYDTITQVRTCIKFSNARTR
jgi:hypothetical protein